MQSQFKLSQNEVKEAVQTFVAKHQRTRSLKVSSTKIEEDGSMIVCAEVEIAKKNPGVKKAAPKAAALKAPAAVKQA